MASSSIFPPTLEEYIPAFVSDNGQTRLYFYYSDLSTVSINTISAIHISVVRQGSNRNVISNGTTGTNYKCGNGLVVYNCSIAANTIKQDTEVSNRYYINFNPAWCKDKYSNGTLKSTGLAAGGIYKIQIRLSSVPYSSGELNTYLLNNSSNFSEWSAYTYTKSIPQPTFERAGTTTYNSQLTISFDYDCLDKSELLYSYRFKIYKVNSGQGTSAENLTFLQDSQEIKVDLNNTNSKYIKYVFPFNLRGITTSLKVYYEYKTINGYTDSGNIYYTKSEKSASERLVIPKVAEDGVFTIYRDEELGRIKVGIQPLTENTIFTGGLYIIRTDNKSGFQNWIDVKRIDCVNTNLSNIEPFEDYTIESGIIYKYALETQPTGENRSRSLSSDEAPYALRRFNDNWLIGECRRYNDNIIARLRLEYDCELTNLSYNIIETKIDTLGGKYPYIVRNGSNGYRSFTLSGLITYQMDGEYKDTFFAEDEIYNEEREIAMTATTKTAIGDIYRSKIEDNHYNEVKERFFRQKVTEFLQNGKPKLFKSATEGNIIVRLTDVQLQPKQEIGRLIYTFSCNAVEIDENTLENYIKYNIWNFEG